MVVLFYAKEHGLDLPSELTARASIISAVQPGEAIRFLQKENWRAFLGGYILGMEMIKDGVDVTSVQTGVLDVDGGKAVFDYLQQVGEVGRKPILFYSWRADYGHIFNLKLDGPAKVVEEDLQRRVEVVGYSSLVVGWFERNFGEHGS